MNDILNQNNQIISVGELNRSAKYLLEKSYSNIKVEGEISNLSIPSSGHMYFTLKDSDAAIRCAMFKNANMRLNFSPKNGDKCIVTGNVSLYAPRGDFQLIASSMEPSGTGNLMLKFEQLKNKLAEEGLFDETKKLEIPSIPKHVAIITSGSTAAWQDVLTSIKRRAPSMKISLSEAIVQGDAASTTIIDALDRIHKYNDVSKKSLVDLILIVRGGGSIEDLWCFNDEGLAREIASFPIPTISGVGHEIDFTICDFVSDMRAPTPTASAEIVTEFSFKLTDKFKEFNDDLIKTMRLLIRNQNQKVVSLKSNLRSPILILREQNQKIDNFEFKLKQNMKFNFSKNMQKLNNIFSKLKESNPRVEIHELQVKIDTTKNLLLRAIKSNLSRQLAAMNEFEKNLEILNPLSILERGYSIIQNKSGKSIKSNDDVNIGESLTARLNKGFIDIEVKKKRNAT